MDYGNSYHIPDVIFKIRTDKGERAFAVEIAIGKETAHVYKGIIKHYDMLKEMALVKKFHLTHGVRTLVVFVPSSRESARGNDAATEAMSLALARVREDKRFTEKVKPYFGFTTLDFLKEDFRIWFDFEGERMKIF